MKKVVIIETQDNSSLHVKADNLTSDNGVRSDVVSDSQAYRNNNVLVDFQTPDLPEKALPNFSCAGATDSVTLILPPHSLWNPYDSGQGQLPTRQSALYWKVYVNGKFIGRCSAYQEVGIAEFIRDNTLLEVDFVDSSIHRYVIKNTQEAIDKYGTNIRVSLVANTNFEDWLVDAVVGNLNPTLHVQDDHIVNFCLKPSKLFSCAGAIRTLSGDATVISSDNNASLAYAELDGVEITGFSEGGIFDIGYATGRDNGSGVLGKVEWDSVNNHYINQDTITHRVTFLLYASEEVVHSMFPNNIEPINPTLGITQLSYEQALDKYPNLPLNEHTGGFTEINFCLSKKPLVVTCADATDTSNCMTLDGQFGIEINGEVVEADISADDLKAFFANHPDFEVSECEGNQISCVGATNTAITTGFYGDWTLKVNGVVAEVPPYDDGFLPEPIEGHWIAIIDYLEQIGVMVSFEGEMTSVWTNTTSENIRLEFQSLEQTGIAPSMVGQGNQNPTLQSDGTDDGYQTFSMCLAPLSAISCVGATNSVVIVPDLWYGGEDANITWNIKINGLEYDANASSEGQYLDEWVNDNLPGILSGVFPMGAPGPTFSNLSDADLRIEFIPSQPIDVSSISAPYSVDGNPTAMVHPDGSITVCLKAASTPGVDIPIGCEGASARVDVEFASAYVVVEGDENIVSAHPYQFWVNDELVLNQNQGTEEFILSDGSNADNGNPWDDFNALALALDQKGIGVRSREYGEGFWYQLFINKTDDFIKLKITQQDGKLLRHHLEIGDYRDKNESVVVSGGDSESSALEACLAPIAITCTPTSHTFSPTVNAFNGPVFLAAIISDDNGDGLVNQLYTDLNGDEVMLPSGMVILRADYDSYLSGYLEYRYDANAIAHYLLFYSGIDLARQCGADRYFNFSYSDDPQNVNVPASITITGRKVDDPLDPDYYMEARATTLKFIPMPENFMPAGATDWVLGTFGVEGVTLHSCAEVISTAS